MLVIGFLFLKTQAARLDRRPAGGFILVALALDYMSFRRTELAHAALPMSDPLLTTAIQGLPQQSQSSYGREEKTASPRSDVREIYRRLNHDISRLDRLTVNYQRCRDKVSN